MTPRLVVYCDRCGRPIEGHEEPGVWSAGFYRRDEIWGQFMDEGENLVCDSCMQDDPRYQVVYPPPQIKDLPQ